MSTPSTQLPKLTSAQFAARIRERHAGAYDDLSDDDLTQKVLARYPQYGDMVDTAPPGQTPTDYKGLADFAGRNNFTVTSTTGGRHNRGSAHYTGHAVDVRTRDKNAQQLDDFMRLAGDAGIEVRDERTRPTGQAEWSGPHLHLQTPSTSPATTPPVRQSEQVTTARLTRSPTRAVASRAARPAQQVDDITAMVMRDSARLKREADQFADPTQAQNRVRDTSQVPTPAAAPPRRARGQANVPLDTLRENISTQLSAPTMPGNLERELAATEAAPDKLLEAPRFKLKPIELNQSDQAEIAARAKGYEDLVPRHGDTFRATVRGLGQSFETGSGLLGGEIGNILSAIGGDTAVGQMGDYLRKRAVVSEQSASLEREAEQHLATMPRLAAKVSGLLGSTGMSLAQFLALMKATGGSPTGVMIGEAVVKNLDKDPATQQSEVLKAAAFGKYLETTSQFRPLWAGTAFAAPTAVEGAIDLAKGRKSAEDVALETAGQGLFGAAFGNREGQTLREAAGRAAQRIATGNEIDLETNKGREGTTNEVSKPGEGNTGVAAPGTPAQHQALADFVDYARTNNVRLKDGNLAPPTQIVADELTTRLAALHKAGVLDNEIRAALSAPGASHEVPQTMSVPPVPTSPQVEAAGGQAGRTETQIATERRADVRTPETDLQYAKGTMESIGGTLEPADNGYRLTVGGTSVTTPDIPSAVAKAREFATQREIMSQVFPAQEHHSASQPRRARNTKYGKRGQFNGPPQEVTEEGASKIGAVDQGGSAAPTEIPTTNPQRVHGRAVQSELHGGMSDSVEPTRQDVSTQPEKPQLTSARQQSNTQVKLEFTRDPQTVADTDIQALFPEYNVTVRRTRPLDRSKQGVELTFWAKDRPVQVKPPSDWQARFGLAKEFVRGQEPELAVPVAEKPTHDLESVKREADEAWAKIKPLVEKPAQSDNEQVAQVEQPLRRVPPTKAVTRARAKVEKVDSRTGLKPTQAEYLAGELVKAAGRHVDENTGESQTIEVPGDGEFTINSAQAANRLHQKITGKPIEGFEPAKNARVPRGTPQRPLKSGFGVHLDSVIEAYGGEQKALTALQGHMRELRAHPEVRDELGGDSNLLAGLIGQLKGRLEQRAELAAERAELARLQGELKGKKPTSGVERLLRARQQKIRELSAMLGEPEVKEKLSRLTPTERANYEEAKGNLKRTLSPDKVHDINEVMANALPEVVKIAKYHILNGAREFADFSREMVQQFGEQIRPHLERLHKLALEAIGEKNADRSTVQGVTPTSDTETQGQGEQLRQAAKGPDVSVGDGREGVTDSRASLAERGISSTVGQEVSGPTGTKNAVTERERAFPKSAAAAGFQQGTDLVYDVATNKAAEAKAEETIKAQGADRAMSDLLTKTETTKDDIVLGETLAKKFAEGGEHEREMAVIDDLAKKLTNAGQTVQAASLIAKLSPTGLKLRAQKILNKTQPGRTLTKAEGDGLVETAKQIQTSEGRVKELAPEVERAQSNVLVEELQTKLEQAEAKLAELEKGQTKQGVERIRAEVRRTRRAVSKAELDTEFAAIKGRLHKAWIEARKAKGALAVDPEGAITKALGEMALNRVRAGVNDAAQLVDDIYNALKDDLPGITRREVQEKVSGYGKTAEPSKEPIRATLRDLKEQMRLALAIEDVEGKQAPRRSGYQRGQSSAKALAMRRELTEKLKASGLEMGSRDPLPAIKRRLQQEIDRNEGKLKQLQQGVLPRRTVRPTANLDAEATKLKGERDALTQQIVAERKKFPVQGPKKPTALLTEITTRAQGKPEVLRGAELLTRQGMNPETWRAEMKREFGLEGGAANQAYRAAYEVYTQAKQAVTQGQRLRAAEKANPQAAKSELQRLVNERLDEQTKRRKGQEQLSGLYENLSNTGWRRAGRVALEVTGLRRAVRTAFDASWGFRQGKIALGRDIAHLATAPIRAIRGRPAIEGLPWIKGFLKQFPGGLSAKAYEQLISERELHPNFKFAQRFKLYLATEGRQAGLAGREESYQTSWAEKIPGLSHSERAYNTMADEVRFEWFNKEFNRYRQLIDPEAPANKEIYEALAQQINQATGRGGKPGGFLERNAPIVNAFSFSAQYWTARVKTLLTPFNARNYSRMTEPARVEAWKNLFSYATVVGGQLALAHATGAKVGLDPHKDDFLKASWGPLHVDFSAGAIGHIKLVLGLLKTFDQEYRQGITPTRTAGSILGTYLRGKEAPDIQLLHDIFFSEPKGGYHTMITGEPVYLKGQPGTHGVERVMSSYWAKNLSMMVLNDSYDAFTQLNLPVATGASAGAVFGEGVQVYPPKGGGTVTIPDLKSNRQTHREIDFSRP